VGSDPSDLVGHETGVAWLISRIAPHAELIVGKDRLGAYGYMHLMIQTCERLRQLGVQVLNLSVATDFPTDGTDPISREVNYLVKNGVVVVVAAGNQGPKWQTIGAPGSAELALTVGKVDCHDRVCWDSSRGPTLDGRVKPDCVAPGAEITAAIPAVLRKGAYSVFHCTSYAVPHVTGTLSLLKEAYPDASAAELRRAIMASCDPTNCPRFSGWMKRLRSRLPAGASQADPRWSVGSGRVNAYRAHELLKDEREKSK
jgi:subtilisin family serine protease